MGAGVTIDTIIDSEHGVTYRVGVYRRRFPPGHRWHGWLSKMYGGRTMHPSVRHWPESYPYYLRENESYVGGFFVKALDAKRAVRAAIRVVKNRRMSRYAARFLRTEGV